MTGFIWCGGSLGGGGGGAPGAEEGVRALMRLGMEPRELLAAVHPDGLAEEQVSGGHFQKARKPQLT